MLDYYHQYLVTFGEILTEIERTGIKVNVSQLATVTDRAIRERDALCDTFKTWASQFCDDAKYMNPQSTNHVQTLLFGVFENGKRIAYEKDVKVTYVLLV